MRIVALDGYTLDPGDNPWDPVAALGELEVYDRTDPREVIQRASGSEVLLVNKTPVSAEALAALPKLGIISVLATGYDNVDVAAARARSIPVCNVPEYGTDTVAQFTIGLLLQMCHQTHLHDAAVREGEWARREDFSFCLTPQMELAGAKMGIVGFGRIGRRVGELAHALGMEVLAHDPHVREPPAWAPFSFCALGTLFAGADVVTLHCPQTPLNTGMVDREILSTMKKSALFINTARGALVVEADLAAALREGLIAGAAIDVVTREPMAADNPLLAAPNCVLTPHMAWASRRARQRLMQVTAENVRAYQDRQPIHVVNP